LGEHQAGGEDGAESKKLKRFHVNPFVSGCMDLQAL
jgi:hypothetical protein